ncbi:MAG: class I SAM-dependent methyltransferase [Desulfatirhabdiaceae bacterium]
MTDTEHFLLLMDGHVHFRPGYDPELFLTAAWNNFRAISIDRYGTEKFAGFLLLTEVETEKMFPMWKQAAVDQKRIGNWKPELTGDPCCLRFENGKFQSLYLVAGEQIVTAEKLEVLSLFCAQHMDDGRTLSETVHAIQKAGGIPVVPWGFGKWLGKRGRILIELIRTAAPDTFFLGETRHRPNILPAPHPFREAVLKQLRILPGSDTLPMISEQTRAGSYGMAFRISEKQDMRHPGKQLKSVLMNAAIPGISFGAPEKLSRFIQNQIELRRNKRGISLTTIHLPKTTMPETPDIETASDDYAGRFSGETGAYFLDVQARITLSLLKRHPGCSVLDVGGGHAQLAIPLVHNGFNVTVTGSHDSCRNRLDRYLPPGGFEYETCQLYPLPFRDRQFDVAIAFRLLPHLKKWQALVSELCRVADKMVIVDYPDIRSFNILYDLLFHLKKESEGNTRPFALFSRKQICHEFMTHHFGEPEFYPEFFIPMVIHRKFQSDRQSQWIESVSQKLKLTRWLGSPIIGRFMRSG